MNKVYLLKEEVTFELVFKEKNIKSPMNRNGHQKQKKTACAKVDAGKNSRNVLGMENSLGQMVCGEEMADDGTEKAG